MRTLNGHPTGQNTRKTRLNRQRHLVGTHRRYVGLSSTVWNVLVYTGHAKSRSEKFFCAYNVYHFHLCRRVVYALKSRGDFDIIC